MGPQSSFGAAVLEANIMTMKFRGDDSDMTNVLMENFKPFVDSQWGFNKVRS